MGKISLTEKENELQIAGEMITKLIKEVPFIGYFRQAEEKENLQELVSKFVFHPEEFMQEIKKILKDTTRTEFENQKEKFLQGLPLTITDTESDKDSLIGGLFLHSKIKDYTDTLDILNLMSMDSEMKETTNGKMLKKSANVFKKYIDTMIAFTILEWYEPQEQKEEKKAISITVPTFNDKYMLMAYNKAAVAMATMDSKGLRTDIAGNMIIETKGVKMQIANFADVSAAFNISTSKLLIAGIICFTQLNNIGDMRYGRIKTEILIPVEEYALRRGYDVEEHPTNTQEEKQKEKNRVKNLLKYVRKEIDKDLELLYNASVSFKTNNGDYADIRIITKKGITNRGKYIQMRFEEDFAKSLKVCRVSMFPVNLFKVKNPVAFRIGVAMSNHYNNDNNLIAGTADRMKIKTLLEYSGLSTLGEVRRLKGSWRQKIQKPFEDALEILHHESMLDNYSYVQTGGIEISELNADSDYYKIDADYQFPDFETWAGLLVKFKLHEAIDHTERIEQKQAEKEEAKANKKKKVGRPKKEIDSTTPTTPKRKRGRPKKTES